MLDNMLLENLLNSEPRCTIRFLAVEFTLLTPLKPIFSDYFTAARFRFRTHSYLYYIQHNEERIWRKNWALQNSPFNLIKLFHHLNRGRKFKVFSLDMLGGWSIFSFSSPPLWCWVHPPRRCFHYWPHLLGPPDC